MIEAQQNYLEVAAADVSSYLIIMCKMYCCKLYKKIIIINSSIYI
jgi:hypothetical protein